MDQTPDKEPNGGELSDDELLTGNDGITRLANTFENSARRWELIVYPSLFAFIILSSYLFYLIYNLSHDVASLATNVAVLTESVDRNMGVMSTHMTTMTGSVNDLSINVATMRTKMDNLDAMRLTMESIDRSSQQMAFSTDSMRQSISSMNYNIGRPMSQMNSLMPW